jgi:DNA mismatch repair protein MutS
MVDPREILVADRWADDPDVRGATGSAEAALTTLPGSFFDGGSAEQRLCAAFGVKSMEAFGAFSRPELVAGAALIAYVEKTQIAQRPSLEPPKRSVASGSMRLDAATRANLELFRTTSGANSGSLLAAIDRTLTAAGARLLTERLGSPLCDPEQINRRLDCAALTLERPALRADLRQALREVPDMVRALSRLRLERGGPRDLDAIRAGLAGAGTVLSRILAEVPGGEHPLTGIVQMLEQASAPLAERLAAGPDRRRAEPQARRRVHPCRVQPGPRRSAPASRREPAGDRPPSGPLCGRDRGQGVENTAQQRARLLCRSERRALSGNHGASRGAGFIHRQTLAGVVRFATPELAELESRIASAATEALALELDISASLPARSRGWRPISAQQPPVWPSWTWLSPRRSWRPPKVMSGHTLTAGRRSTSRADAIRSSSRP